MSPNAGEGGGVAGSQPISVQLYTGSQINFGDLTPYLSYGSCGWLRSRVQPEVLPEAGAAAPEPA
jgi:hypothetical protein